MSSTVTCSKPRWATRSRACRRSDRRVASFLRSRSDARGSATVAVSARVMLRSLKAGKASNVAVGSTLHSAQKFLRGGPEYGVHLGHGLRPGQVYGRGQTNSKVSY